MHALVVTFVTDLPDQEYSRLCDQFVEGVDSIDGLVTKVFLREGSQAGGVYLFADRAAVEAYLAGPIVAGLQAHPGLRDLTARTYAVDTEHSAHTGLAALVGSRA